MNLFNRFELSPRQVMAAIAATSVAMLAFGLYLQHAVGLEPCPMCIVQRYALVLVAVVAGVTACFKGRVALIVGSALGMVMADFGAFVAARQSWLQLYPPESASCGRDSPASIPFIPCDSSPGRDWSFSGTARGTQCPSRPPRTLSSSPRLP